MSLDVYTHVMPPDEADVADLLPYSRTRGGELDGPCALRQDERGRSRAEERGFDPDRSAARRGPREAPDATFQLGAGASAGLIVLGSA
jgi:hypothetical protein